MSWTGEYCIGARDSERFARLSGDFNPLHLDPVAARRTAFGGTVVHGIHLLLAALERATPVWCSDGRAPTGLAASFSNPVRTGERVQLSATVEAGGERVRLAARTDAGTAFAATLTLQERRSSGTDGAAALPDAEFAVADPEVAAFPPAVTAGAVPLALGRARLKELLPSLTAEHHHAWLADLLATTRIVGMHCPGRDSIYSVCRLQAQPAAPAAHSMSFQVARTDERFRMVRLQVSGGAWAGHLEALFRAPPVQQPLLSQVAAAVPSGSFTGQRALVIGGSRGLGELSAKISAAGGGEVVITYAQGCQDAERVCAEAQALGFRLSSHQLDLSAVAGSGDLPQWLAASNATHLYYFASPPIRRNPSGSFSDALYRQFAQVYVRAFAAIAERLLTARAGRALPCLLYPSSVFLDTAPPGFAEYCRAKAEGEELCTNLARRYGAVVSCPRLPRMRTDQTSMVRDADVPDSLPILLALLSGLPS